MHKLFDVKSKIKMVNVPNDNMEKTVPQAYNVDFAQLLCKFVNVGA